MVAKPREGQSRGSGAGISDEKADDKRGKGVIGPAGEGKVWVRTGNQTKVRRSV